MRVFVQQESSGVVYGYIVKVDTYELEDHFPNMDSLIFEFDMKGVLTGMLSSPQLTLSYSSYILLQKLESRAKDLALEKVKDLQMEGVCTFAIVFLTQVPADCKIKVIKAVKEITGNVRFMTPTMNEIALKGLDLRAAKSFVESVVPKTIEGFSEGMANAYADILRLAGAKVVVYNKKSEE